MTFAEYLRAEGLNWSLLKHMDDSALAFRHARDNEQPDTATLARGRYVHAAVLQPETLGNEFAIWTGGDRRGNAYKAFAAANEGKTIFKPDEIEAMDAMARAVRAHPAAAALLAGTVVEAPVFWTDLETGLKCKARPDFRCPKRRIVGDLKTTRSIDVRRFGHDIARYQYHRQLAHYTAGIISAEGWTPESHVLIAVETAAPYDVAVFPLSPATIEMGAEGVAELLARVVECEASGEWPGRHPKPVTLDESNLPPWIFGGGIPEFEFTEGVA